MHGLMMNQPLMISGLLRHAETNHGDTEIVSRLPVGGTHRYTYAPRCSALAAAGVCADCAGRQGRRTASARWPGTRTAISRSTTPSRAWRRSATPSTRACFPEQISYIANHADDRYVFFDVSFIKLVEALVPHCPGVKGWIAMCRRAKCPQRDSPLLCYEELIAAQSDDFDLAGVRREHRLVAVLHLGHHRQPQGRAVFAPLTVLHAYGACLPDAWAPRRATASCRWCRCSTSMPGACPTPAR
jgi:hypothetical protein